MSALLIAKSLGTSKKKSMNNILILLTFTLFGCFSNAQSDNSPNSKDLISQEYQTQNKEYDFDNENVGSNSPKEVALNVISFLKNSDTSKYLQSIIPLEAQKYLSAQNFEFRPDIKNKEKYMKWLESRFADRMDNFFVRANYILEIMKDDKKFNISEATIDTITTERVRIKRYGDFNRFIVGEWSEVTIKMNYNNEVYYFEIPQIIKLKEKWFLYYPEFYLRTASEKTFVEQIKKDLDKDGDEFWK